MDNKITLWRDPHDMWIVNRQSEPTQESLQESKDMLTQVLSQNLKE